MPKPFDERVGAIVLDAVLDDEQIKRFSSLWLLHSRCSAFVNTRDRRHLCFDLGEAHTEASNLWELARTPFDLEVSFFIKRSRVARPKPAVVKLALCRVGVIEVSSADRRTTYLDLASLPIRNFLPFVVNDADRQIVQRETGTAQLFAQAIRREAGNAGCSLHLAIHQKKIRCGHDIA